MKVISISDKEGSAIDRLAMMNAERWEHFPIAHLPIHPKKPEPDRVELLKKILPSADLINFEYHKTAVMLRKLMPEIEKKKMVLVHHNEHNIEGDQDWKHFKWDAIVCKNGWQFKKLKEQGYNPILIKHAVEFNNFKYTDQLTDQKIVGYVGQIKKVKGVRELKKACDELGYRLLIVGKPSEAQYWADLDKNNLEVMMDVPDDKIGEVYSRMRTLVCNSDDGTESGTMPILEAMVSGIPVVTRNIGLVRDCGEDGKNMIVRKGSYTDIEDLKAALRLVVENDDIANSLRENAWRTVRQYHPDIQAREFDKLFRKVLFGEKNHVVSVIMPTFNRAEVLRDNLLSLQDQSYENFEVAVCDDGSVDHTEAVIDEVRKAVNFPVRYVNTGDTDKYGLAKARNLGLIESIGEIIVLCDDRLKMHDRAIEAFVNKLKNATGGIHHWVWGSKGTFKSFVENFSATWRRVLINGGMFNERIDEYGGMTQEVANRFSSQGIQFDWCPEATCEPIITTHSKSKNRESIIRSKIKLYKMGFQ